MREVVVLRGTFCVLNAGTSSYRHNIFILVKHSIASASDSSVIIVLFEQEC